MACKVQDEYAHLIDSPYGQAPDVSKSKPGSDKPASAVAAADAAQPSSSRALMRVDGQKAPNSEAEAARKAREVRNILLRTCRDSCIQRAL